MQENVVALFKRIRLFSTISVIFGILLSLLFSDLLGESSMGWQVAIAVTALAIGIPHGALDHLVTLPKAQPKKMAIFIVVYVAVAVVGDRHSPVQHHWFHYCFVHECDPLWYW